MKEFGALLLLAGVIYLFIAWSQGLERVQTIADWFPAAAKILIAFAMIYFGIVIAS